MSLYDRLDWTRPSKKLQILFAQRVNLTRPANYKLRCYHCNSRIQRHWEFCPACSALLSQRKEESYRRSIFIDLSGIIVADHAREIVTSVLIDALSKVFSAFRSVQVFLTSDPPNAQESINDFTHVYVFADECPVGYLGMASFRHGMVTDKAIVRIDQVLNSAQAANLGVSQIANLIANTIAHEVGHTLGLDHSALPTDVMHDGLDYTIHSFMPPSFHAEQINAMNLSIRKHRLQIAQSS